MMVFKIVGIGIITMVLCLLIKQYRTDIAIIVSLIGACLILGMCLPYLESMLNVFKELGDKASIDTYLIEIVLKIIGISYICQFASDICKDAGESAIAGKIELGGKIVIITLSMPIIYSLLDLINDIINF